MTEKNIMVIPARKRVGSTAAKEKIKKLRVAAYCRVSTETEEQNSSYEVQVAHYTECVLSIPACSPATVRDSPDMYFSKNTFT